MANIESVKLPDGTQYDIKDAVSGYASKVTGATNGNFAALDSNGDLTDSGHKHSDYLSGVDVSTATNGQALIYNGGTSKWENQSISQTLSGLTDTTITTPSDGQLLAYDGANSKWVNTNDTTAKQADISSIVTTGATNTTGSTITKGTYFYLNGVLVKAKADIASGASYTSGTNYEAVTVGGALTELNFADKEMNTYIDIPTTYNSRNNAYTVSGDGYIEIGAEGSVGDYINIVIYVGTYGFQISAHKDLSSYHGVNSVYVHKGMKVYCKDMVGTVQIRFFPLS